jgi:hypothetical protein
VARTNLGERHISEIGQHVQPESALVAFPVQATFPPLGSHTDTNARTNSSVSSLVGSAITAATSILSMRESNSGGVIVNHGPATGEHAPHIPESSGHR